MIKCMLQVEKFYIMICKETKTFCNVIWPSLYSCKTVPITGALSQVSVSFVFQTIPSNHVLPLPRLDPAYVSLLISGLTAGIALDKVHDS